MSQTRKLRLAARALTAAFLISCLLAACTSGASGLRSVRQYVGRSNSQWAGACDSFLERL